MIVEQRPGKMGSGALGIGGGGGNNILGRRNSRYKGPAAAAER